MLRKISCAGAVLATLFSLPASAATCGNSGGPGVWLDISTPGATCAQTGNGLTLNTGSDPFQASNLDTNIPGDNRVPALTINFILNPETGTPTFTDGSFSFNPAGLTNLKIGFQLVPTIAGVLAPDWFVFSLLDGSGSGTFDADFALRANGLELPADAILYGVLYGDPSPVPLPGAAWLFGSVLGGFVGFQKYRNRRKATPIGVA